MSEDLILLEEYIESLNLKDKLLTLEDLKLLRGELKEAGEFGLANWVANLSNPQGLLDYLGEDNEV